MPLSVTIYFSFFITFALWAHVDDIRTGKERKAVVLEAAGTTSLIVAASSYWIRDFPVRSVAFIALMFLFGLWMMLRGIYLAYKDSRSYTGLNRQQDLILSICGLLLTVLVASPLILWSMQSVFKKMSCNF